MQESKKNAKISCLRHPNYTPGEFPHLDCSVCCKAYREHVSKAYQGLEDLAPKKPQTNGAFDPATI